MSQFVVTGIGVVSPIGIGVDAFWKGLAEGRSGVGFRTDFEDTALAYKLEASVRDFEGKKFVKPRKALKVMCRPIQFGFAAAGMAFEQAQLEEQVSPDRFSTVFGTETFYSDPQEVASVFRRCIVNEVYDHARWGEFAMREIEPLWMLKYLPNMVASHISIALDARGPSNTICQSEASSTLAIIEACGLLERGIADVVMVGGTGSPLSITGAIYRGDADLSNLVSSPEKAARPFDKNRDGMILGEGAGCLVLERKEFAEARGQKPLAEIVSSCRAYNLPEDDQFDDCIEYAINASIERAGIDVNQIDHVNASGFSTQLDDAKEAQAIRRALGDVNVVAPKSNFGNLGPGTGIVELIASICSLQNRIQPAILNFESPDPDCPVNVVKENQPTSSEYAVSINHSLTGQISSIVLKVPR